MLALLMAAWLQASGCSVAGAAAIRDADQRLHRLDASGALQQLDVAAAQGCPDAEVAALFLRALAAARAAYASGGSRESLQPVDRAAETLAQRSSQGSRLAALAHAVLMAASAAAQSERDDMTTWLEQAASVEGAVNASTARIVDLPLVAGDLWLQVHRFDAARTAYRRAASVASTLASSVGLARAAVRLDDRAGACEAYRTVVRQSDGVSSAAAVAAEARAFVDRDECRK